MAFDLSSFLKSTAPDVGQMAATAVQDFAGASSSPPPAPSLPVGTPVVPMGPPDAMGNVPVFVPGAAGNPPMVRPPAGVIDQIKALPLPTKLIAGAILAAGAYALANKH